MAKPAAERLQLATYPVCRQIETRFGDVDALGHLNNVALARIYEDARVRFLDDTGVRAGLEPKHRFVMAELAIQYLAEGGYPEPVVVGTAVLRIGGASSAIVHGLFQNGACIGTAQSVLVHVSRLDGRPRPLPQAARAALQANLLPGASEDA